MFDKLSHRIIIPIDFTYLLIYLFTAFFITASVGKEKALGTITYFIGWLLVGHGIDLPGFRFNLIFASLVLMLTFLIWWTVLKFLRWLHSPKSKDAGWIILIWFISFLFSFLFMLGFGYFLMWFGINVLHGQDGIPLDLGFWVSEDILEEWEESSIDFVYDIATIIPTVIILFIVFEKLYSGYEEWIP